MTTWRLDFGGANPPPPRPPRSQRRHRAVDVGIGLVLLLIVLDFLFGFPLVGVRRTLEVNLGILIILGGILALFVRQRRRRARLDR